MSLATKQRSTDAVNVSPATALSPKRLTKTSRAESVFSAAHTGCCTDAFRCRRIQVTRGLIAAGDYDSDEVLDAVLDRVLENLTS